MEFPYGHHHRHDPEEDERRERPPPYYAQPPPPPQPYYQEPHVSHVHHSNDRPEGFGSFSHHQPPPPPQPTHVSHVYHASDNKPEVFGSFNYQQPPPPPPPVAPSGAVHVAHVSHEKTETAHHHSFEPHLPSFLHLHSHSGSAPAAVPALAGKPTVKFFCKAEPNFSLTIRNGKVVLGRSDPSDQFQVCFLFSILFTRLQLLLRFSKYLI